MVGRKEEGKEVFFLFLSFFFASQNKKCLIDPPLKSFSKSAKMISHIFPLNNGIFALGDVKFRPNER